MPANSVLFGDGLRPAAAPWREELGKSDRNRLDALLGLAVAEHIRLSDCLQKKTLLGRLNEAAFSSSCFFHWPTSTGCTPNSTSLGWRWTDPATGQLRILPAEAFGPFPTS